MTNNKRGYFKSKKEEVDRHIDDIKSNFKVLTRINNTIKYKKRRPLHQAGFYKKDIQGKKEEILEMLKDEQEFLSSMGHQVEENKAPSPSTSDNFDGVGIYNVVLKPIMERQTGVLKVSGSSTQGELWYENGSLFHALLGSKTGERAFFETVQLPKGVGEFFPQDELLEEERSITGEVSIFLKRSLLVVTQQKNKG